MKKLYLLIGLIVTAVVVAACGANANLQDPQAEVAELGPTATTRVELTLPTEAPTEPDECTACHIDKDRLIDTAAPEEEVVEENEGAG